DAGKGDARAHRRAHRREAEGANPHPGTVGRGQKRGPAAGGDAPAPQPVPVPVGDAADRGGGVRPPVPGRGDQGGGAVRRRAEGTGGHRQRREGDDPGHVQGEDVLRLLLRLPRRVQVGPGEVRQGVRGEAAGEEVAPVFLVPKLGLGARRAARRGARRRGPLALAFPPPIRQNAPVMGVLSRLRPPLRRPTRRGWRWAARGVAILLAVALGYEALRVFAGSNRHTVLPGRVYRCAQPDGADLRELVRDRHIKTVINLRGVSPGYDWYTVEARTLHELNVSQEDVTLSANRLPP